MSFKEYRVLQIIDVHDGDTVEVHLDEGLDDCATKHIRLLGVFARELKTSGGPEARQFVVDWIAARAADSWTLWTLKTKNDNEVKTLGRFVGDLEDVTTGEHLCAAAMAWLILNPASAGGTGTT